MTARVTQTLIVVGYTTSPDIRITSVVMEVVRPNSSVPDNASYTQVVVVAT